MKFTDIEIKILKELYNSPRKQLEDFTLFKRIKVSFTKIYYSLNRLNEAGLIIDEDGVISITETGKKDVVSIFTRMLHGHDQAWREIPSKFTQPKLDKDSYYIPNISLLDDTLRKDIVE